MTGELDNQAKRLALRACGEDVQIYPRAHIVSPETVSIGDSVIIDDFVSVSSGARIYTGIDDFSGESLVGPGVPEPWRRPIRTFARIGKFAVVGANAVVFPGVTLGEGCAVGALSLVNRDCEPWTIYGGVPARPIKARRKDRLLELEADLRKHVFEGGRYVPGARR